MALKTTRYDTADYLLTEEDRFGFLLVCLDEAPDDSEFFAHALGVVARSRNMSQLSRDTGLTREGLYKALSGYGNPGFATVWKVLNALGYRLAVEPIKAPAARKMAASRAPTAKKAPARRAPAAKSTQRIAAKRVPRPASKSTSRKK